MPTPYVASSPAAAWIAADDIDQDERLTATGPKGDPTIASKFPAGGEGPFGLTLDDVCQMATDLLFWRTAAHFLGTKTTTVRPHRLIERRRGLPFPVGWGYAYSGAYGQFSRWFPEGWPDSEYTQTVTLDGPNTDVTEVQLWDPSNGVEGIMPSTDYKLRGRDLWRLADPVTNSPLAWPSRQRLDLPLGEPYTWAITYSWGARPDWGGIMACRELAIEIAISIGGGRSRIPGRVISLQQHGTNVQLENSSYLRDGMLGLPMVDQWVDTINPVGLRRRPTVLSPQRIVPSVES